MFTGNKRKWILLLILFLCSFFTACSTKDTELKKNDIFYINNQPSEMPYANPEIIKLHEENLKQEYLIGPGDVIYIDVWNRQRLCGEHVVGPFGEVTLPLVGDIKISGLNKNSAAKVIGEALKTYYNDPIVGIHVLKFMNNRVYVLGRVTNPGVINFSGEGSLLEALSMAGGLPSGDKSIFLSKCYIIRGKDQIIWIDLIQLLQKANLKLNIRLANNDIIYIPESIDSSVFVMGEVKNPGSYPIHTASLSLLDAINLAGGPTEDANIEIIHLIRDMKETENTTTINLEEVLEHGNYSQNYVLRDNDIIYIPRRGIASFNYYLRQIEPFMRTFINGVIVHDAVTN